MLAQFVAAQLQPLPPGAFGRAGPAFHKGHIFPLHGVGSELLDEVAARRRARGHAKDPAGILVKAMNGQGLEPAIGGRQRPPGGGALPGLEFARQKIGQDAQRGQVAVRRRHRDEAGPLVDDCQGAIQVKQRNARVDLPPGAAVQRGGVPGAQFERCPGVGEVLVGFPMDHAAHAHATRENPLLGAVSGRVGMRAQQPIQQGLARFLLAIWHLCKVPATRRTGEQNLGLGGRRCAGQF